MKFSKVLIVAILWLFIGTVYGQGMRVLEIDCGYFNPKRAANGMIFSGSYGVAFDERVDISLGISYFYRNYRKDTKVASENYESGVNEETITTKLEYNTTLVPITASINIKLPFQPPLHWRIGGGLSYQFLFNNENNYEEGIKAKRCYSGFGWIARAGIEYDIGSRSSIIIEAFYNNCKVKGNKSKKEGLPVWDQVDMSGLGFRAGIRLAFF